MKATLSQLAMKYPILWDTNHINYYSKEKIKYWEQLRTEINAYYTPGLTLKQLKKKVIYLRQLQLIKQDIATTSQADGAEKESRQKEPMTKKRTDDSEQDVAKKKRRHDIQIPECVEILNTIPNAKSLQPKGGKSDAVTKFAVCRICLSDNEQLMVIINTDLQRVYQKLTLLPFTTSDARPQTACLMCINLLRTAHKLMADSLQAEEWFTYTLAGVDLNKTVQPSSSKLSVVEIPSLTISSEHTEDDESIDINEVSKNDSAICNSEDTNLLMQCGISGSVVPKTEYIPAEDEQKTPGHSDASSDDGHLVYDIVKEEPGLEEIVDFNDFRGMSGQIDKQTDDNVANNMLNTEPTIKRVDASKEFGRDLRHVYSFGKQGNKIAESQDEKDSSESPNSNNIGNERIVAPKTYISMNYEQPGTNDAHSGGSREVGRDRFGKQVNMKAVSEESPNSDNVGKEKLVAPKSYICMNYEQPGTNDAHSGGSREVGRDRFGKQVNMKAVSEESPNSDNVGKERIVAPKSYICMSFGQPYGTNDAHSGGSREVGRDLRHVYSFGIQVNMKAEPEEEKGSNESPTSDNVGKERIVAPKTYISMDSEQPYGTNEEDSDSDEEILKIVDDLDRR